MKTYGEKHIEWVVIDFEAIAYNKDRIKHNYRGARRTEIEPMANKEVAQDLVKFLKKLYANEAYNAVVAFRYVEAFTIVE